MRGNNRNDNRRASTVRDRSLFIPWGGGGGGEDFSDLSLHFLNTKPVSLVGVRYSSRYVVEFAMGVKYDP